MPQDIEGMNEHSNEDLQVGNSKAEQVKAELHAFPEMKNVHIEFVIPRKLD